MNKDHNIILYYPKTFHEENYKFYWIPYSLLSVSTYIYSVGYFIKIIDNNADVFAREREFNKEFIKKSKVIGISAMIGKQITDGMQFASYVREVNPEATIVWGGYAPTLLPELFVRNKCVDIVVRGQGEETLLDIVNAAFLRKSFENIKGIIYKKADKIVYTPVRKFVNLDNRPFYPFSLVDVKRYIRDDPEINTRTINYVSSQGCPFSCGFCAEVAVYRCKWLYLSAENMVNDIKYFCNNYLINGIKFYDPNFYANKNRLLQFLKHLNKNDIRIRWAASAHPNNLAILNDTEWELLKKSGCSRILIGAESGSQEVLNLIHKNITIQRIIKVAKKLSEYDIIGSFTFVVGFPNEPPDSIEKTLRFAEELLTMDDRFEAKIHFYLPYPGTPLFNDAVSCGFRPPNTLEEWSNYDYYTIGTWVDKSFYELIRKFNERYCPYVQKILTGGGDEI